MFFLFASTQHRRRPAAPAFALHVTGAGSSEVNGGYIEATSEGKPETFWYLYGSDYSFEDPPAFVIKNSGLAGFAMYGSSANGLLYENVFASAPWDDSFSGWAKNKGDSPAPNVTQG